ncbi:MAG: hypothetical protein R3D58_00330 [Saprospiraceae bacterium]|jgi:hypothetical protein|nr:hypothetical protein [Lewinellaceae bacterium]
MPGFRSTTAVLLFALLPIGMAAQGPLDGYLKGKGVLDLAPSISFNSANSIAGAGGQTFDVGYKGSLLGLFAEYGLSERIDVVGTAAYVFTSSQSGLQDGGLFLKYRPVYTQLAGAGRLGVLVASGLGFPLADYEPVGAGALGQKAVILPARLILQWETPIGLFLNLTGGYNWRFDRLRGQDVAAIRKDRPDYQPAQPADFSTVLFKLGFPSARFYLDGWLEWQHTAGGNDFVPGIPDLPQAFGVSFMQIGGTAYYSETGKNGFYLSSGYILGGRNVSRILRLTAGMVFKF